MSPKYSTQVAWATAIWGPVSIVLVLVGAPMWLRLPVVGLFSLIGFGLVVVVSLRIESPALALTVGIGAGFAALIVSSLMFLYTGGFSALGPLIVEAAGCWVLAALILSREEAGEGTGTGRIGRANAAAGTGTSGSDIEQDHDLDAGGR